jgi:hypothetical protein
MRGKIGASQYTVTKLLTYILLIVILALVIYGYTHVGFGPLRDSMKSKINEVLVLLNIKDDPGSGTCEPVLVINLNGGKEFLEKMGLDEKSRTYVTVCEKNCEIRETGIGDYVYKNNNLYLKKGSVEVEVGSSKSVNIQKYKDIFDSLMEQNYGDRKIKDYYNERFTEQFILIAERSPSAKVAIWANGYWKVIDLRVTGIYGSNTNWRTLYEGLDVKLAFEKFIDSRYSVKYRYSDPTNPSLWKSEKVYQIRAIVGGSDDKINSKEANELKEYFDRQSTRMKNLIDIDEKELGYLIELNGTDLNGFTMNIITNEKIPYFKFSGTGEEYILVFNSTHMLEKRLQSLKISDNNIPSNVVFADFKIKEGNEWKTFEDNDALFLSEEEFVLYRKRSLINQFIERYC